MHLPVLTDEVLEALAWSSTDIRLLDLTVGGGGHLEALLKAFPTPKSIVAVDRDPQAIERSRKRLSDFKIEFIHANYSEFLENGGDRFDRILMDCGVSSFQLDDADRGFSFKKEGPLDMRMNPEEGAPVWEWLEHCDEKDLADVIYRYGEDRQSRVWARKWVNARKKGPVRSTKEFVEAFGLGLESRDRRGHHPMTRVFQALRIFINDELSHLTRALERLPSRLEKNGRLAIISFHSLEDREVKWGLRGRLRALNKKVIIASDREAEENPRSRSAKLRAYIKDEDLEENQL